MGVNILREFNEAYDDVSRKNAFKLDYKRQSCEIFLIKNNVRDTNCKRYFAP